MSPIDILKGFDDVVSSIDHIEFEDEDHVSMWKIKARLFDSSVLWIREVYVRAELVAYSYYWLREDNSVILGWDNAPHHSDIATFPHHKHISGKIAPSQETDLRSVILFIQNITA